MMKRLLATITLLAVLMPCLITAQAAGTGVGATGNDPERQAIVTSDDNVDELDAQTDNAQEGDPDEPEELVIPETPEENEAPDGAEYTATVEEREMLENHMSSRGIGGLVDVEPLYDASDYPKFLLGVSASGHLIMNRDTHSCMEWGSGTSPYEVDGAPEGRKYYCGVLEYYVAVDGGFYYLFRETVMHSIPGMDNMDTIGTSYAPPGRTYAALLAPIILPNADSLIRERAYGNNDNSTCTAVAMQQALNYLDKTVNEGFVPSMYESEKLSGTNLSEAKRLSRYACAINFHEHLVNDCFMHPVNFAGMPDIGMVYYALEDMDRINLGLHVNNFLNTGPTHAASFIKSQFSYNKPVMVTTIASPDPEPEYGVHSMLVYGLRETQAPDGTPEYEILVHSGWADKIQQVGSRYLQEEKWLPIQAFQFYYEFEYDEPMPLSQPNLKSATSLSMSSVKLEWAAVKNATRYDIYRSETAGDNGIFVQSLAGSDTTYTDNGLTPGKTYYYSIMAFKAYDPVKYQSDPIYQILFGEVLSSHVETLLSNVKTVTPSVAAPTLTSAAPNTANNAIDLKWTESPGAEGYMVLRSTTVSGTPIEINAGGKLAYSDTGVQGGVTYYYKVKAYYGEHRSVNSNTISTTLRALTKPVITAIDPLDESRLRITWDRIPGATGYILYRSMSSDSNYEPINPPIEGGDTTSYIDTGLTQGKYYYYKVQAVNNTLQSPLSNYKSGIPTLPPTTLLSATPVGYGTIELEWEETSGASGYHVYYAHSPDGFNVFDYTTVSSKKYSYVKSSKSPGVTMYFYVTAYRNSYGQQSMPSNIMSATLDEFPAPDITSIRADSSSSVTLSWKNLPNVKKFDVYRSFTPVSGFSRIYSTKDGDTTSYTNNGLSAGSTYYYYVDAYDGVVYSYDSDTKSVTTPLVSAPRLTSVQAASLNSVTATWTYVPEATGYELYRSTSPTGTVTKISIKDNTTTSYTNTGLVSGTTYFYKVVAVKDTAKSPESELMSITLPILSAPGWVCAEPVNYSSVEITWDHMPYATAYEIHRSTSPTGTFSKVHTTPDANVISFTNTKLVPGTTYYYKVKTKSGTVLSDFSDVDSVTLPTFYPPEITSVTTIDYTTVRINWSYVKNATSYELYRSTSLTGTYSKVFTATSGELSCTLTNHTHGTTYYYKVRAKEDTTYSDYSEIEYIETQLFEAPAIYYVSAINNTTNRISWSANYNATGYELYRATSETGTYSKVYTATSWSDTVYDNTGLNNDKYNYYYKVRAKRDSLTSDYSEIESTAPLMSEAVNLYSVTANGYDSVDISWASVPGASSYLVYYSSNPNSSFAKAATITNGSTNYTHTGKAPGATYYYKVRAKIGTNYTQYSQVKNVTLPSLPIPRMTSVSSVDYTTMNISWSSVAPATGYLLYRSTSPTTGFTKVYTAKTGSETTYTNTKLTPGTTYFYRVCAVVGKNNSAYSDTLSATLPIVQAPNLYYTEAEDYCAVFLSWVGTPDATGYEVHQSTSPTGTFTRVYTISGNIQDYTKTSLVPGTAYYYKIKTKVGTVTSDFSNVNSTTLPVVTTPVLTSAAADGYSAIRVEWTTSSNATGYEVHRSSSPTGTYTRVGTVTSGSTGLYSDEKVNPGAAYYYKVLAKVNKATSTFSNVLTAATPVLGTPTLLSIAPNGPGEIVITWSGVTDALEYEIHRSTTLSGGYTRIDYAKGNDRSYTNKGLRTGNIYFYKVCAKNGSALSEFSNILFTVVE